MKIYTSQFRYSGEDRLDITVKSGNKLFAPTWEMVMGHKNGTLADEDYIKQYKALMNQSYKSNRKPWKEFLSQERVTLVCYCGCGKFCHRVILAEMLVKAFDCEYVGEVDSNGNLIEAEDKVVESEAEKEFCESCLEKDLKVEMFTSEHLDRCPRCLESSFMELTGKEHYELLQKEIHNNEHISERY